jgi:hypothetical protein
MLSTSLAAVVLSGVTAASSAVQPSWQTDYVKAAAQAAESSKPIAVFIAHGGAGYARVVADGGPTADDARRLKQSYVCLYVDTATDAGKKLADAFEMKEGLVISGRSGEKQALRIEGKVPQADLSKYLTRFAEPERVVTTTETPGVVAPVVTAPPVYYPAFRPAPASCST